MAQTAQGVTFPSGAKKIDAYLARPEGEGSFPAVVVIHEAYGLNENIRDITRRFANEGYIALAVDLFAGRNRAVCMFSFMTAMFFNSLNHQGIVDLKAALTFLSEQPGVDTTRLGAIGFCMGGGFAIAWACTDSRLKVIAPFYASNPRPLEAVARLCPVVGSYPTADFTTAQGHKLEAALQAYNIPHDIKFYPGAKHSFFNEQGSRYNHAAAEDAWQRVLAFFNEQIGTKAAV
ncbi:MAG TPA: dienelactone hydrolase family protein [Ktedonobacteraceae bacterium]|nr:dienelactone hydrolase family protein [Ktedonobacteraceae bacterium]